MKLSRFNYVVQSPRDPNLSFLYNSFHDNRIAIEDGNVKLSELLEKIEKHSPLNQEESESASSLQEMGYVLPDDVDEQKLFSNWFNNMVREQDEILVATIVTTIACNLRCTYCYEKESLGKSKMTPAVMEKTIAWLKERIDNGKTRKVNLIFFGGEPLLNVEAIRRISGEIYRYSLDRDIEFSSGMVTNGIFLTPKLVEELQQYGVNWLKITFDGDQDFHDRRRIYSGGRGTFEKIFSNLESIADTGIKILLGGNFDRETADSFRALLSKIQRSKFYSNIVSTNIKPFIPPMTQQDNALEGIAVSCQHCAFGDFEINKMMELREQVREIGLAPADPINAGPCDFYQRNSMTIGVEGQIYKCVAFIGLENTVIGNIEDQKYNHVGEAMLQASKPFENPKCKSCAFPPICGGGCRGESYTVTGSFNNISCQQDYFLKTIPEELVLQYYDGVASSQAMGEV